MRDYELTLVLRADLADSEREEIINQVVGWLPLEEGAEPAFNHWGRKRLAYPINKLDEGYYVLIEAKMETEGLDEVERNISYVEDILRHLLIRKEEEAEA